MRAVVPVKRLQEAKGRLAEVLAPPDRAALSEAMLADVLNTLACVPALAGVSVITCDRDIAALARRNGARIVAEPCSHGLSAAVRLAAEDLARHGEDAMVMVPADVPLATPGEIAQVVESHQANRDGVTLVAARDGQGTNCMALRPGAPFPFSFGPGSFQRHCRDAAQAGIAVRTLSLDGLAFDIDEPHDLADLGVRARGGRTGALLARLGLLQPVRMSV